MENTLEERLADMCEEIKNRPLTVSDAIDKLNSIPKYILSEEYVKAIEFAVKFMMDNAPKPSLDGKVREIKFYRGNKQDWLYCKHVPSGKEIGDMTVGELCELVKTGGLDNDKFETFASDAQRKLNWWFVFEIKNMLILNKYLAKEEVPKGRESK